MPAPETRASVATYGVDLVDKDDARCVFFALLEKIADPRSTYTDKHLDEVGARNGKEWCPGLAGDRLGKQGFARPGRAHQQNTLGDFPAEALELLRILEELDDLFEFLLGLVDPGDVGEGHFLLVRCEETGLRFAEGHRLGATGLHLPEEHKPQSHQDQQRRPAQKSGKHAPVRRLFDLDVDFF